MITRMGPKLRRSATFVAVGVLTVTLAGEAAQTATAPRRSVQRVAPSPPVKSLRLKPLDMTKATDAQKEVLGPEPPLHVRLCASNLPLCEKYFDLTVQLMTRRMGISVAEHVMLALRTAWLNRSHAVWGMVTGAPGRVSLGARALAPDEILRVVEGPGAKRWTRFQAALLQAADDMHVYRFIQEPTWKALSSSYNDGQMFEVVMTIGHYTNMSGYFNSLGIPPPPNAMPMPDAVKPSSDGR